MISERHFGSMHLRARRSDRIQSARTGQSNFLCLEQDEAYRCGSSREGHSASQLLLWAMGEESRVLGVAENTTWFFVEFVRVAANRGTCVTPQVAHLIPAHGVIVVIASQPFVIYLACYFFSPALPLSCSQFVEYSAGLAPEINSAAMETNA